MVLRALRCRCVGTLVLAAGSRHPRECIVVPLIVCRPRVLTPEQHEIATRRSVEINPANALARREIELGPVGRRGGPRRLVIAVGYQWPASGQRLPVQFLDTPSSALRKRILAHMNAWSEHANVRFDETRETGRVRIARLDRPASLAGYWSYLGTQVDAIPPDEPTLNLEGFTMRTPDREFRRVVRHEAGHALGFEHEHLRAELIARIDRRKAFAYFDRTQGWSREETLAQVLTPLAEHSILGTTEADPLSVMCYQIPAEITKDGKAIPGGSDITALDAAFAARIYPRPASDPASSGGARPASAPDAMATPRATDRCAAIDAAAPGQDTFHLLVLDPFDSHARTRAATQHADPEGAPPPRDPPHFLRVFASYGGARASVAMQVRRIDDGAATRFGRIIATHERIKRYTGRESGSLPDEAALIAFGGNLFDTLFDGDVRRLFDEARARQHGRTLDLILTSMVSWIAEKPWEFAYDTGRRRFLATEDVHFLRNVVTSVPADRIAPQPAPLRILVVAAQPLGAGRLSIAQETAVIRRGFEALVQAGLAQVTVLPRATPGRLHAALQAADYAVLHFIGHGRLDEDSGRGALVFEDEHGHAALLGQRAVREIICQRGIRLVFLNACQSGAGSPADFGQGVAQSLVAHGVPALVANQYSVLDTSATHFAQHFYRALAQGHSVGAAAREARIAVNYSLQGEIIDWAIPVVYARDPGMTLCAPVGIAPAARAAPAARRTTAVAPRAHRIAVWDIDNVFPALDASLARMDRAQRVFGFERTDLSAPVDAWDLEHESDDGRPALWAEKLAHRFGRTPMELGVDLLIGITRHALRDDEWLNLHGWWPDEGSAPIVLLSFAGFEELPSEGARTERALARLLLTALAGYFGRLATHDGGPRDCPMSRAGNLDLRHLTRATRFDPSCRAQLRARLPDAWPALDALSAAFR
jgi:hypothetical protein